MDTTTSERLQIDKIPVSESYELATFAGGCFWCMVSPFEEQPGIIKVVSGYTGGHKENPTYKEVCSDKTGHLEAVQITFNPSIFPYRKLLDIFWRQIDPTDPGGQFHDRGESYRTAIFCHNEKQKQLAEQSKSELESSGRFDKPIATLILPASTFYPAEEYHQNYHKKNELHYKSYRVGSGRDAYIRKNWRDLEKDAQLKQKLTPIQYKVTQENETEPPFQNEYWDNKKDGIYVDIVSGEPLFSSLDKFDSGCGWPSFSNPIYEENISYELDLSHNMKRTEVRGKNSDSHLGHVYNDGPLPSRQRYCINSAALRFIPKEELEKEGYGEFKKFFENKGYIYKKTT